MTSRPTIERFETSNGARIYRLPLEVFPNGFIGYSFVILNLGVPMLVDTGSGYDQSNCDLLAGFDALRTDFGESIKISDIQQILVTHGHVDHFGGVAFVQEHCNAQVSIHPLDRRVLTAYEERVIVATKDLRVYLERAGTPIDRRAALIEMYGFAKKHIRSVNADFDLDEDTTRFEGMRFIHAPGHCSGQVCIMMGDTLLSADHILSHTSPHQAPESITHYTGLGHYRDSLRKFTQLDGVRLALGGHESAMDNAAFTARLQTIHQGHERKLNKVLEIIAAAGEPQTIAQITRGMYPDKTGYDELLALEEAGAHIEYLYQRGQLSVANLEEVEAEENPVLRYAWAN